MKDSSLLSTTQLSAVLSESATDQRFLVLQTVARCGSISEAARDLGMSYKAAWQALDQLRQRLGVAVVQANVGGRDGGGAQLTPMGQRLLQAYAHWAALRDQFLMDFVNLGSEGLARQNMSMGWQHSMRNRLLCEVETIHEQSGLIQVGLRLPGQQQLRSTITKESQQQFNLRSGLSVWALCKATAVHVVSDEQMAEVQSNPEFRPNAVAIRGEVAAWQSKQNQGQDEVSLRLEPGQDLIGFGRSSQWTAGQSVCAMIAPQSVVLARAA